MIIGSAVTLAILRIIKTFRRKKAKKPEVDFKKEKFSMQHDCSDCAADCMLRDSALPLKPKEQEICDTTRV